MTPVLVTLVICASALAALVLVLRFFEKREAARVALGAPSEELKRQIKAAEDRLSRLEMSRMAR